MSDPQSNDPNDVLSMGAAQVGGPLDVTGDESMQDPDVEVSTDTDRPIDPDTGQPVD